MLESKRPEKSKGLEITTNVKTMRGIKLLQIVNLMVGKQRDMRGNVNNCNL